MTTILDAIGWPAGLACLVIAACAIWRGVRRRLCGGWLSALTVALVFLAAALADFTVIGVLSPVAGGVLAFLAVAGALAMSYASWKDGEDAGHGWRAAGRGVAAEAIGYARNGLGFARADTRGIWHRIAARIHGGEAAPGETVAVVAEHVATRNIPSVMEDPFLGAPMQPAEIAAASPSVPVPAPWLALAQYIAERDPEDDQDLRMFSDGDAAGALAIAEAYHAFAGHCLNGIGLSPAYVAGVLEAGDSAGGHATLMTQVHRRFQVIYDELKGWIATNGPLPHKARTFLTDSD